MRSNIPTYRLATPSELGDALAILARQPGAWKPFAGGTDLMVLLEAGQLDHRQWINIRGLRELRGIEVTASEVVLGALTTFSEVQRDAVVRAEFPMLALAASETGGVAIQNRGTLGGNIMNASPAADSCPSLLCYDAELELASRSGVRRVAYDGFHIGYKQTLLRPDELLRAIHLPRTKPGWTHYYRKVGTRKAQAISKVCFAAAADLEGGIIRDVRIALGSVAPTVIRGRRTEAALRGHRAADAAAAACAALDGEIAPIDDLRSTAAYRRRVSLNLLRDFLATIGY